jgi:membrane protein
LAGLAVVAAAIASILRRRTDDEAGPADTPAHTESEPRTAALFVSLRDAVRDDEVPTLAAAMVYYGFLALFPGLIAVVSIYGLVSDPQAVADQIARLSDALPAAAADIIESQLTEIVSSSRAGLGIGLILSLAATFWSVSSGVAALVRGINGIFETTETRSFLQLRLLALALTAGLIVFAVVAVFIATALPATLRSLGWDSGAVSLVSVFRWIVLGAGAIAGLTVFYRVAPNRRGFTRWWSIGAVSAAVLWLVATLALNFYVAGFASYNDTYGALGGVIVLMLWMYVSSFIILLGAEVDAVREAGTG